MRSPLKPIKSQHGIVLVAGLMFLIMLCVLGTLSINSTITTEKMTQNLRDMSIAFSAAESALSDGETWLLDQTSPVNPVSTCTTTPCAVWQAGVLGSFYTQPDTWWQNNAKAYSGTIYGAAGQPYYLIEHLYFVPNELSPDAASKGQGYYYYRITARGNGTTKNASSIVQSVYVVQYY